MPSYVSLELAGRCAVIACRTHQLLARRLVRTGAAVDQTCKGSSRNLRRHPGLFLFKNPSLLKMRNPTVCSSNLLQRCRARPG